MTASELLIHTSGLCALTLSLWSACQSQDFRLMLINLFGNLAWGVNSYALGSLTGAWVCLLIAAMCFTRITPLKAYRKEFLVFSTLYLVVNLWITWIGPKSIPSTMACFFLIYGTLMHSGLKLRLWFVAAVLSFLTHALIFGAIEQAIANVTVLILFCRQICFSKVPFENSPADF